jgi:hypothetical protein
MPKAEPRLNRGSAGWCHRQDFGSPGAFCSRPHCFVPVCWRFSVVVLSLCASSQVGYETGNQPFQAYLTRQRNHQELMLKAPLAANVDVSFAVNMVANDDGPDLRLFLRHPTKVFPLQSRETMGKFQALALSTTLRPLQCLPSHARSKSFPAESNSYKRRRGASLYFEEVTYGTPDANTSTRRSGAQRGAPRRTSARGFLGRPLHLSPRGHRAKQSLFAEPYASAKRSRASTPA